MKQPTKEEIEKAINELKSAMLEAIDLDKADEKIKFKKQKCHYRLNKAREDVRALRLDY